MLKMRVNQSPKPDPQTANFIHCSTIVRTVDRNVHSALQGVHIWVLEKETQRRGTEGELFYSLLVQPCSTDNTVYQITKIEV